MSRLFRTVVGLSFEIREVLSLVLTTVGTIVNTIRRSINCKTISIRSFISEAGGFTVSIFISTLMCLYSLISAPQP